MKPVRLPSGTRPIERTSAQNAPFEGRGPDVGFHIRGRLDQRYRPDRRSLVDDLPILIAVEKRDTLLHVATHSGVFGGGQEVAGAFAPNLIVQGPVLGAARMRNRRREVKYRIAALGRLDQTRPIQDIANHGVDSQSPQPLSLVGPPDHGAHLMPPLDQPGQHLAPQHAGRANH